MPGIFGSYLASWIIHEARLERLHTDSHSNHSLNNDLVNNRTLLGFSLNLRTL